MKDQRKNNTDNKNPQGFDPGKAIVTTLSGNDVKKAKPPWLHCNATLVMWCKHSRMLTAIS